MTRRRIAASVIAAVLWLAVLPPPAAGYVVPGPQAIALMTRALGSGKTLSVKQRVRFIDLASATAGGEVIETALYALPERYRSDIHSAGGSRIHVEAGGRSVTITNDRVSSLGASTFDQHKDLLLYRKPERLMEKLAAAGVNPFVSSLGRLADTLVVIIGARYPDETKPQLWIDKDSFFPLRWILRPAGHPGGSFEIRFSAWQEVQGQWYPRRIECHENGVMTLQILAEQVLTPSSVNPGDFDIDALKARYGPMPAGGAPEGGPPVSEIDKAIEDFRNLFETN